MSWDEADEATRVYKMLNNGMLEPEDLTHNEFRVLRKHYPKAAEWVRMFLEERHKAIENGEWSEACEPKDRPIRIARYDAGNGLVDKYKSE